MILNCKSGSYPHCDCVQFITVEKVDAFLELKIFKNNCSTVKEYGIKDVLFLNYFSIIAPKSD